VVDDTEARGDDDDERGWDLEDLELPADVTSANVAGTTHSVPCYTITRYAIKSNLDVEIFSCR